MTEISIPVSTNVVSFLEEARSKYTQGKINYEQFCNIEMIELGYNPSSPKERREYTDFIESLSDLGEFEIEFYSDIFFEGEADNCNEKFEVECEICKTIHTLVHMEWETILCCSCSKKIKNPYNNNKE